MTLSPQFPRMLAYDVLGAAGGYAWYRVVGCRSGTCLITARWWTATLYGIVMGAMLGAQPA